MAAPPPCLLHKNHPPKILSLLPISLFSIYTPKHLHFLPLTSKFPTKPSKSLKFSSHSLYDVASHIPDDEEEPTIGDCLVFEEGIFDEPSLQNTQKFEIEETTASTNNKITDIVPENLIPENWLEIQKELNITKKERRKLREQLEYGRTVEKRRQDLRPIHSEVYEQFKNEKLKQLKPVVFDNPVVKVVEVERNDHQNEEKGGRVAPRNPRLAVYGGGLDDISEVFSSESYDPKASDKSQGPRKLFSKEEKILLNRRVLDLTVATSEKWNPLHTLAASGEFYLVNSLLKHNIDINTPDKDGLTAIHKAILGKKQAVFNFLLRESINPFVRDREGATLLHYAVYTASSQMIKILLLYNVDINLQDDDGWTPLHLAVQSRRTDIVRLLLIKGADKSLKNRDGLTPLELCLHSGRNTRTYELIRLIKRFS